MQFNLTADVESRTENTIKYQITTTDKQIHSLYPLYVLLRYF